MYAQIVHARTDLALGRLHGWNAECRIDLRYELRERTALTQHGQHPRRTRFHEPLGQFLPDALRRQRREFARGHDGAHQRLGFRRHGESQACSEACDAQHAQRVLDERGRHMAQHAGAQVGLAAVRVDEGAVLATRHRIDREIAPRQVLLQRDIGRREELESPIAAAVLALGARERVFLVRFRMQEHWKVAADRAEAGGQHRLRRDPDDDKIPVGVCSAEQFIADGAADFDRSRAGCGSGRAMYG